jgi:hypothetical protein
MAEGWSVVGQPEGMRRIPLAVAAAVTALTLGLTGGCSSSADSAGSSASSAPDSSNPVGDIPDNQVYIPYTAPDGSFTVDVPEGWARTDSTDTVSFTDKLNTVSVQELTARPAPTPASVTAGELAAAVSGARNGSPGPAETVSLQAGNAVHATYSADAAPDPVTGRTVRDDVELYVFWQNGTEALLTLSGPHGADNVDPWKRISTSFAWRR